MLGAAVWLLLPYAVSLDPPACWTAAVTALCYFLLGD